MATRPIKSGRTPWHWPPRLTIFPSTLLHHPAHSISLASGDAIPIEQHPATEITHSFGRQTAPDGIEVYNPAFDVTPARLVAAIICERGVIQPVTSAREIKRVLRAD